MSNRHINWNIFNSFQTKMTVAFQMFQSYLITVRYNHVGRYIKLIKSIQNLETSTVVDLILS